MEIENRIIELPVDALKPDPSQPRKTFPQEDIENMAMTIKTQGTINPIEVDEDNVIITGEIRWRGAKKAGVKTVPVKRIQGITTDERLERQLIENLHHKSLEPRERENAIYALYKSGRYGPSTTANKETISRLAKALGYSHNTVSRIIEAKEARDRLSITDNVSTTMIAETAGLDDKTRITVLQMIERGKIKQPGSQTKVREAVQIVKKAPEPIKEKFLEGEISQEKAERIVAVYEKAPKPLREAIVEGEVEPEQAEEVIEVIAEIEKQGREVAPSQVRIVLEDMKKESRLSRAQQRVRKETFKEVLKGEKEAIDTLFLARGRVFVREVKDVAWKVRGWGIPQMMQVGAENWKEAQKYFKQIQDHMNFLLRAEPLEK